MRQIIIALVLFATTAQAETIFSANAYLEGTVAFTHNGVERLPLGIDLGLGMTNVISKRLGWYSELSVATPLGEFALAPRLITGPSITLSDHWSFSPVALYQFNPSYDGVAASHLVGGGANLMLSVSKEITLGLVVGGAISLGTPELSPSLTVAPNVSFTLP